MEVGVCHQLTGQGIIDVIQPAMRVLVIVQMVAVVKTIGLIEEKFHHMKLFTQVKGMACHKL